MIFTKKRNKIAIIGGGISGLATAYFLKKKFGNKIELCLFEATDRVGGLIKTVNKGGFLFELGPHSLRMNEDDHAFKLIKELDLEGQILIANPQAKNRFLFLDGSLQKVTFPLLAKNIIRSFFTSFTGKDEGTVASFFAKRFSSDFVERFVDPLMRGIYGGDPHFLSMKCCLPYFYNLEKKYGSFAKGLIAQIFAKKKSTRILTFKNGMATLTDKLATHLENSIRLHTPVAELEYHAPKIILTANGKSEECDHVISALPAPALSKVVKNDQLQEFSYASFVLVQLSFHNYAIPFKAFGYLVPSREKQNILGAVFDSILFPEQNRKESEAKISVIMGGWGQQDLLQLSDDELYKIAFLSLESHFKKQIPKHEYLVTKLPNAVPQYFVGHEEKIELFFQKFQSMPIHFVGSLYGGVSVVDCIANAKSFSERFCLS